MIRKDDQVRLIEDNGVVAIVRLDSSADLIHVSRAIREGGIRVIEFTLTTPNAIKALETAAHELADDILLGVGTVLDAESASAAILAGAQFIVTPALVPPVIEMCHRHGKVVIPGAFTPTEILTAWEHGADFVKVFPAEFFGPQYLRAIRAPLPQVKLIPVGGVSVQNAGDFIRAGASAVGVGAHLANKDWVASGRFDEVTRVAKGFRATIEEARQKQRR